MWHHVYFAILQLLSVAQVLHGYTRTPTVYTDLDIVDAITPLLHGFSIHMKQHFVDHQLDRGVVPNIYVSAVPLDSAAASIRRMLYSGDILGRSVTIRDLQAKSWYVICLEFQNMHERQRHGNTSTSCVFKRTLDPYGNAAHSVVSNISLGIITDSSIQVKLQLNVNAPLFLELSLEHGSCELQRYFVSQPKSIHVQFMDLTPGFNYGRICIRELPTAKAYTAMGRTAFAQNYGCYMDGVTTQNEREPDTTTSHVRVSRTVNSGIKADIVPRAGRFFGYFALAFTRLVI